MGILALYDTVSIQKYIFRSNRLRDNRGASLLVEDCFTKLLPQAMKSTECELIYAGGGNALLHFDNELAYKTMNTCFSKLILEQIPGLYVVTEYLEENNDGNFGRDVDRLFKKLQLKKLEPQGLKEVPGLSITRECAYTRKPALELGIDGRWISAELVKKRERVKQNIQDQNFKEMKDLAGKEGSQWAAVVHLDGNRMGENIRLLLNGADYKTGKTLLKSFSANIQRLYNHAYNDMVGQCSELIKKSSDSQLSVYEEDAPFRKIYGAGDDLTFVCYGSIAIKAVELFIKNMEILREKADFPENIQISACAGIAFMKPGFPFYRAYEIAESCCRNAKVKARQFQKQADQKRMGNYVDFHIIHGSIGSLSELRKREYQTPVGNLLMRPYSIFPSDNGDTENSLALFYEISDFIRDGKIARSKWKELRNSYYLGLEQAEKNVRLIRRRYEEELKKLEHILEKRDKGITAPYIDKNSVAILWDALEMMDLYIRFRED